MKNLPKPIVAAAVVMILAHVALVVDGARRNGGVYDETVYPASGYAYWTTGDYRMNPEHPPLMKLWTGVAWLGADLKPTTRPGWTERLEWPWGLSMLYQSEIGPQSLLLRARVPVALLSAALALAVFLAARRLAGARAAAIALALYAFDPLTIAHGGLATTDLGAAAFYFVAATALPAALRRGGVLRVAAAGVAVGLSLASKFSTMPIVAVLIVWAAVESACAVREGGSASVSRRAGRPWLLAAAIGAAAAVTLLATYGPAGPSSFVDGLRFLGHHQESGHGAYAFGRYSATGWWWYFPAAWAVKTPLPILLLSLSGVALALARARSGFRTTTPMLLAMAAFAVPVLAAAIQIGVRHLLPLTPFLAVFGGLAAEGLLGAGLPGRAVFAAAATWLVGGTLLAHPLEMGYSNELARGPRGTWRVLADSNVDWGQDLPRLVAALRRQPLRRVYLGLAAAADPAAYGLPYCRIPSFGFVPPRYDEGPDPSGREWIAVSTTVLLDVMVEGHAAYAWLRERPMTAFVGTSIALYDITGDARAHRLVARTAMEFDDPEAARPALERLLELEPGRSETLQALARVEARLGRFAAAVARCEEAVAASPGRGVESLCEAIRKGPPSAPPPLVERVAPR